MLASAMKLASLVLEFLLARDKKRLAQALEDLERIKKASDDEITQALDARDSAGDNPHIGWL